MTDTIINTGAWESLLMHGGNDFDFPVIYQDANGVPIDLTGMTFSWTFTVGSTTLTATIGSGLTVTPLLGKIVLHLSAVQTATLPQGLGRHKLRLTAPTAKILMRGALVNDT